MFIIIREVLSLGGKRDFVAEPFVYSNEVVSSVKAQQFATKFKCRAWAAFVPDPPLLETASVADIEKFRKPLIRS